VWSCQVYLVGRFVILEAMKTAVSLPDQVFHKAEQLARQLGVSRSELYKKALENFFEQENSKETLLENLNRVYSESQEEPDPAFGAVVRKIFENNEWEE
jgi:Arc/MetJ-type ribon-helix-helix transcriptional regulator